MKIKISQELVELANLLKKKAELFVVGGYVRNYLLGVSNSDVDLASKLTLEKLESLLKNTPFMLKTKDKELGTAQIYIKNQVWEYSTFRKESYGERGDHRPKKVTFIAGLLQDAKRRDFTINSIYYNIIKDEIVDVYSGIYDLENKVLRSIETPDYVFQNDGVRILRMIRISSELGFKIDKKTYQKAKQMVYRLKDISATKKAQELQKVLDSSEKYPISKPKSHLKGLRCFNTMGIWSSIFSGAGKIKYKMVKKVDKKDRLIGLLIDLINTVNPDCISYYLEKVLGKDGLDYSKAQIKEIVAIISGYFDALNNLGNKKYFFNYYKYFEKIGEILQKTSKKKFKKYNFFYQYINKFKIPIQLKDIKINGNDLKEHFPNVAQRKYGQILEELFNLVFDLKVKNEKDELIKEAERIVRG